MAAASVAGAWAAQSSMRGAACCWPTGVTQSLAPPPAEATWNVYVSSKSGVSVPVHRADQLVGPTAAKAGSGEPPGRASPAVHEKSTRSSHRVNDGAPERAGLL